MGRRDRAAPRPPGTSASARGAHTKWPRLIQGWVRKGSSEWPLNEAQRAVRIGLPAVIIIPAALYEAPPRAQAQEGRGRRHLRNMRDETFPGCDH
jgi:hypothetical protein